MSEVSVQELGAKAAYFIDHVRAGERVDITDSGVLVARVVPPHDQRHGTFVVQPHGAERC